MILYLYILSMAIYMVDACISLLLLHPISCKLALPYQTPLPPPKDPPTRRHIQRNQNNKNKKKINRNCPKMPSKNSPKAKEKKRKKSHNGETDPTRKRKRKPSHPKNLRLLLLLLSTSKNPTSLRIPLPRVKKRIFTQRPWQKHTIHPQ